MSVPVKRMTVLRVPLAKTETMALTATVPMDTDSKMANAFVSCCTSYIRIHTHVHLEHALLNNLHIDYRNIHIIHIIIHIIVPSR